jgi:hypothetical protein
MRPCANGNQRRVFFVKFNKRSASWHSDKVRRHARERAGSDSFAAIYTFDDPVLGRFLKRTPGPPGNFGRSWSASSGAPPIQRKRSESCCRRFTSSWSGGVCIAPLFADFQLVNPTSGMVVTVARPRRPMERPWSGSGAPSPETPGFRRGRVARAISSPERVAFRR